MNDLLWIYEAKPWMVLIAAFALLFLASYVGYRLGSLNASPRKETNALYLPDSIPSTILGLLALILGFTFSMTIGRFENRRQLAVAEANAIGTTYLRASLLRSSEIDRLETLIEDYTDSRIAYYENLPNGPNLKEFGEKNAKLQREIWDQAILATRTERGAIEHGFILSLNSMFDLANERNIALSKTLPGMIYWSILFIAGAGLAAYNFTRGQRKEVGQWQVGVLAFMLSFVFFMILDIDRPTAGMIRISQDAMLSLRKSLVRR